MGSVLSVWVVSSPNAPESTFISLGLSTQFAAT
jgi:hypothetical protein